jgi:hypothetical protein
VHFTDYGIELGSYNFLIRWDHQTTNDWVLTDCDVGVWCYCACSAVIVLGTTSCWLLASM